MLTAIYGALAALALWRVRAHAQGMVIAGSLLVAFALAAAMPMLVDRPALAAGLALVEALLAIWLMFWVVQWRHGCDGSWCTCSLRAMAIGIICLGKIAVWTLYTSAVKDLAAWNWYAAAINGGFVAQAAIAGGFGDGVGNRVADLWHRFFRHGARADAGRVGGAR